jgi:hypothetical protein
MPFRDLTDDDFEEHALHNQYPMGDWQKLVDLLNDIEEEEEEVSGSDQLGAAFNAVYLKSIATNVTDSGAVDTSNDTTVVSAAITAARADDSNMWNGYHVLYFPGGHTYTLSNLSKTAGAGSNLMLLGDGDASVIKRITSDTTRFSTWTDNEHVMFHSLAFDANNVEEFAGWRMGNCQDFHMEQCHWYDSDPRGFAEVTGDRYGLYFGFHAAGYESEDVVIRYCLFEDLQLEVDHCRRVLIEHNTIMRSPSTCALGTFGVSDDCTSEDYVIRYNHIIGTKNYAIGVVKDESSSQPYSVKRIAIYCNKIEFTQSFHTAVRIGTNSTVNAQTGDTFEDIQVCGNHITYDTMGAFGAGSVAVILFQSSATAEIRFVRVRIVGNIIEGNGNPNTNTFDLRRLDGALVNGNTLRGVKAGISLAAQCRHVLVSYNNVEADRGIAYVTNSSTGDVTFVSNFYAGNPTDLMDSGSDTTTDGANSFGTPTVSGISALCGQPSIGTATFNPGAIADGAEETLDVTLKDAALGNLYTWSFDKALQGLECKTIEFQATDTVRITFINRTGGEVTPTSGTVRVHKR